MDDDHVFPLLHVIITNAEVSAVVVIAGTGATAPSLRTTVPHGYGAPFGDDCLMIVSSHVVRRLGKMEKRFKKKDEKEEKRNTNTSRK